MLVLVQRLGWLSKNNRVFQPFIDSIEAKITADIKLFIL